MNSTSQFDLHPDAESLNAFAEHVLPEAEQARVLAHLADCNRCRKIVYFAQEAAAAEGPPAPVALATSPFRIRQVSWWRFAWVSAAAFSALISVAVVYHFRTATAPADLAKAVPQGADKISEPVKAIPQLAVGAATRPVPPSSALGFAKKKPAPQPALRIESNPAPAPPPASVATQASAVALSKPEASADNLQANATQPLATNQASYTRATGGPSPLRQQPVGGLTGQNSAAKNSTEDLKMPPASANQTVTVDVSASAVQLQTEPAGSPHLDGVEVFSANATSGEHKKEIHLPSALPVISTARAKKTMLAIDAAGAVYLSMDEGKTWESIVPQWTGHAMKVRLAPPVANFAARLAAPPEADANKQVSGGQVVPLAAAFEIENDSHQFWISGDGKTWNAQ